MQRSTDLRYMQQLATKARGRVASSAIRLAAIPDAHHEYHHRRILDLAHQPVVVHPTAPQRREGRTTQRFALVTRIDPLRSR